MGYENCGRKSKYRDAKRDDVTNHAWYIIGEYLKSKAKLSQKVDRALKLVGITHKTQIEHSGNLNLTWTDILHGFGKSNRTGTEADTEQVQQSLN